MLFCLLYKKFGDSVIIFMECINWLNIYIHWTDKIRKFIVRAVRYADDIIREALE